MDKESRPKPPSSPAPQDEINHCVQSDLQYVSIQVDGATYGGWYRLLPDGRMELLALANAHCEHRHESAPDEQARGMLADLIHATRSKTQRTPPATLDTPATLGSLLYADKSKPRIPERDWAALVLSSAAGDLSAFHGLFQRTHHLVFTLILRLTRNRETAEDLTLIVFEAVVQRAETYDPADGSVVAWIMNQARSTAMNHLTFIGRSTVQGRDGSRPDTSGSSDAIDTSPPDFLWERLVQRVAMPPVKTPHAAAMPSWTEPAWEDVAPGISCKLLATDGERDRVSMLVRLAPGSDYPAHTHAGVEELHLLDGELMIDAQTLHPGDYNRAERGTADKRVWSETGCMCVLITSTRDVIA